jgi:hypothetical protein
MAEVTAGLRASLSAVEIGSTVIRHAQNNFSSNKTLVSAPLSAQFRRGYIRGYDRHTEIICDSSHWGTVCTGRPGTFDDDATVRTKVGEFFAALVQDVCDV